MTPDETKLADTLHQKLGVVESRPFFDEDGVRIEFDAEAHAIRFFTPGMPIGAIITPERLKSLNGFAESIGWQCD